MSNTYFRFKQFTIHQELAAMKVTTDACLFGAWVADDLHNTSQDSSARVLDIGAGTGLLSLMAAQNTNAFIDAIEIDDAAARQATENFTASPWSNRLRLIHGDVRETTFPQQYDSIISNPPFYEKELIGENKRKNIAHHDEGLLLKELITLILTLMKDDGCFYLLLPEKRTDEVLSLISSNGMNMQRLCRVRQSTDHGFFRTMIKGCKKEASFKEEQLSIRKDPATYTSAFEDLLRPYYLYL